MELSTLIPTELQHYQTCSTDRDLFLALVRKPADLVHFFITCAEDETWGDNHRKLLENLLMWLSKRTYRDTLTHHSIRLVADVIHAHYSFLSDLIPSDLDILVEEEHYHVNSLLFSAASERLRQRMRDECHERGKRFLVLKGWNREQFSILQQYMLHGTVEDLWRLEEAKVMLLMEVSASHGVTGLRKECADVITRYLTPQKAIPLTIYALNKYLPELQASCADVINHEEWGFKMQTRESDYLAVRMEDLKERTLQQIKLLIPLISHVSCSQTVLMDPQFGPFLNTLPRLNALELSGTRAIGESLIEQIPTQITRLEAVSCGWLDDETFGQLMQRIDDVLQLDISSTPTLTYIGFFWLARLYSLEELHLARCPQISDEMLILIFQACRHLVMLDLERCDRLSEKLLHDLGRYCVALTTLNLSHCNVTDGVLLELASRLPQLQKLEIKRCMQVSDKGILEFVRRTMRLQYLDISQGPYTSETIRAIRDLRPNLELITEN